MGGLSGTGGMGSIPGTSVLGLAGMPASLSSMPSLLGGSGTTPAPYAQAAAANTAANASVNNLNANANGSPSGSVVGMATTSMSTGLLGVAPTSLSLAPCTTSSAQGPPLVAPTPLAGGVALGGNSGSMLALARPPGVHKQNGSTSESHIASRLLSLFSCINALISFSLCKQNINSVAVFKHKDRNVWLDSQASGFAVSLAIMYT